MSTAIDILQIVHVVGIYACVIVLAMICIRRGGKITGLRSDVRRAYRDGLSQGERLGYRTYVMMRKRELQDAGRNSEPQPGAGPSARVSTIRFGSRENPKDH